VEHENQAQSIAQSSCNPTGLPSPNIGNRAGGNFHEKRGNVKNRLKQAQLHKGKALAGKKNHPDAVRKGETE
jgi:hypothetical protein